MKKSFLYSSSVEEVLNIYNKHSKGNSLPQLAKEYNISIDSLRITFLKNNLPILRFDKKPTFYRDKNESYFDQIDNEEKAYFLGFIMADGNIDYPKSKSSPQLRIAIQKEDIYILKILQQNLCPSKAVKIYPKRKASWKDTAYFSLVSQQLCDSLINWGIVPRKSYKELSIPKINKSLIRHFIRGYFDGDGSIVKSIIKDTRNRLTYSYERFTVTFSGSHNLLTEINNFFVEKGILSKKVNKVKNKKHSSLVYASHISLKKIFNILYTDSSIYLKRKYDKFVMLIPS